MAGPDQYGVAAATLGTMRLIEQASSLALVALVFTRFVGGAAISPETAPAPSPLAVGTAFGSDWNPKPPTQGGACAPAL